MEDKRGRERCSAGERLNSFQTFDSILIFTSHAHLVLEYTRRVTLAALDVKHQHRVLGPSGHPIEIPKGRVEAVGRRVQGDQRRVFRRVLWISLECKHAGRLSKQNGTSICGAPCFGIAWANSRTIKMPSPLGVHCRGKERFQRPKGDALLLPLSLPRVITQISPAASQEL